MAKHGKDASLIENYLVYGVDIHHRRIYFGYLDAAEDDETSGNDVKFDSVALAIRGIDKMLDFTNKDPIEIHMTSYGGDPYQMLALVDKIQECPCPVKFYGRGRISSAATWVMAVCDERYLAENTTVMIHDGSDGFDGTHTDMQIHTEEAVRLQDQLNEVYAKNSRMPLSFWENIIRRDLYLTADETILLGLADSVIPYKGRANFRKLRAKNLTSGINQAKLKKLVNKIADKIKLPQIKNIDLHVPVDKVEDIAVYDNTELELKNLEEKDLNES